MKFILIISAIFLSHIFNNNLLLAQNNVNTTAAVNFSLIRGLTLTTYGSNTLDFGEVVVTGNPQTVSISNEDGQIFHATGHPWRPVVITYSTSVTLNNNAWVAINGGTEATLTFTTNIADGNSEAVYAVNPVPSGTEGFLVPSHNSYGEGFLWLGGEIDIAAEQPQGEYVGELNVSLVYN